MIRPSYLGSFFLTSLRKTMAFSGFLRGSFVVVYTPRCVNIIFHIFDTGKITQALGEHTQQSQSTRNCERRIRHATAMSHAAAATVLERVMEMGLVDIAGHATGPLM